jgi:hypothetical protein
MKKKRNNKGTRGGEANIVGQLTNANSNREFTKRKEEKENTKS